jgi:hypothetical protein
MYDGEVVDTSDAEETAESSQYWRLAAPVVRDGFQRLHGRIGQESPRPLHDETAVRLIKRRKVRLCGVSCHAPCSAQLSWTMVIHL